MIKKNLMLMMFILTSFCSNGQTPKSFKWIPWKSATTAQKAALRKIEYLGTETVYDHIIETLEDPCEVNIAVLDMDGDGKMEYAVRSEGGGCCGSLGCSLKVFSDGGKKYIMLTDYLEDVRPVRNGVVSSKGILIRFQKKS